MNLTAMEKALLLASIDNYRHQIRTACEEDQGTPDGEPGTVGNSTQKRLKDLRHRIEQEVRAY